jgi:hypothetical protein
MAGVKNQEQLASGRTAGILTELKGYSAVASDKVTGAHFGDLPQPRGTQSPLQTLYRVQTTKRSHPKLVEERDRLLAQRCCGGHYSVFLRRDSSPDDATAIHETDNITRSS